MVTQASSSSAPEAEAGGSLQIRGTLVYTKRLRFLKGNIFFKASSFELETQFRFKQKVVWERIIRVTQFGNPLHSLLFLVGISISRLQCGNACSLKTALLVEQAA